MEGYNPSDRERRKEPDYNDIIEPSFDDLLYELDNMPRSTTVSIRMDTELRDIWKAKIKELGFRGYRDSIEYFCESALIENYLELHALINELSWIGNNLNQLTRKANMEQLNDRGQVKEVLEELSAVMREAHQKLARRR